MQSLADILVEQGRVAGDARRTRGALWGNLAQYAGTLPREVLAGQQQEQDQALKRTLTQQEITKNQGEIDAQKVATGKAQKLAALWNTPGVFDAATGRVDLDRASQAAQALNAGELLPLIAEVDQKGHAAALDGLLKQSTIDLNASKKTEADANAAKALRPESFTLGPEDRRYQDGNLIATGAPKVTSRQAEWGLLGGKKMAISFDPSTGKRFDANNQDVTSQVQPIPPASVQVLNNMGGEATNGVAKMIAEYRMAPPSPRTLATPAGEMLLKQVAALNPSYDATQYPTRQKMRQAFTSGPQSQTINSLNTAIGHLDQFVGVADALGNGNFQPGNTAYNWLKTTFGDSAPTNFEGIRSIMAGELASAFKKSGATDEEIASVKSAINAKNSPKQLNDYVKKIAMPALGSKVVNFDQQYRQVMGADDPFKILLPESEEILKKHGIDPAHPSMGGASHAAPTGGSGGGLSYDDYLRSKGQK